MLKQGGWHALRRRLRRRALRLCRTCGHVGCCDDSPNRHATKHFHNTRHPIIEGYDPPEGWGWCYVDEIMLEGWQKEGESYLVILRYQNAHWREVMRTPTSWCAQPTA